MENKIFKILPLVCHMLCALAFYGCGDGHYAPMDYRIFRGTPVWELAKAVRDNDTAKIRKLVEENNADINYRDSEHGFTVLMCALCHSDTFFDRIEPETIRTLLELGADPNLYSGRRQMGKNAVLVACENNYPDGLSLLLRYGGDPNSQVRRTGTWENDNTALMEAVSTLHRREDIRCVKLLVEHGADMNAVTRLDKGGVLSQCLIWDNYKALIYLLHKGIDYNLPVFSPRLTATTNEYVYINILAALRDDVYELDSEEYRYKREIIKFLNTKGLDYYSTPIPEYTREFIIKKHPDDWEEFIKVY